MDAQVVKRNKYHDWVMSSAVHEVVTYEPSRLGVAILGHLANGAGGIARRQYVNCGDQLLQELFAHECIMWGHWLGERAVYITPMGMAVLGEHSDKRFVERKRARVSE
jgi:hypothetical protein